MQSEGRTPGHGITRKRRRAHVCRLRQPHARQTALQRQLRCARLMIGGGAGCVLAYSAALLHGDTARGAALLLAVALWTLSALLPLLTGRLKVGAFEGELRE